MILNRNKFLLITLTILLIIVSNLVHSDARKQLPWMGVLIDATPNNSGATVKTVGQGTPAYFAGIIENDIITNFNNVNIEFYKDVAHLVATQTIPGQEVPLTIIRRGKVLKLTIIMGKRIYNGNNWQVVVVPKNSSQKTRKFAKKQNNSGSGFLISKLGHIITNEHVVQNCKQIHVGKNTNTLMLAKLLDTDKSNDLALLRISNLKNKTEETSFFINNLEVNNIPLASNGLIRQNNVRGGEDVLVAGFPYGDVVSKSIKVTKGIISSTRGYKDDTGQFQIDAAVQPGNSGGPIYDRYGNIIGVVVAQLDKLKVAKSMGSLPENINFGIKASTVKQFLNTAGLISNWSKKSKPLTTEKLFEIALQQTVIVVCNN